MMVQLVKRIEAHYEAKEVGFGKVYRWRPERRVIECECGERPTLTGSVTTCDGCGTDYTAVFGAEPIVEPD
jgi:hypothetical protein